MKLGKWLSTVAGAAVLSLSLSAAQATTITGFASFNGGPLVLLTDADAAPERFVSSFSVGGFSINIETALSTPASNPALLSVNSTNTHDIGSGLETLSIYFVSSGNLIGGPLTFRSAFTSNADLGDDGGSLAIAASTWLGAPVFPVPGVIGTQIGSALYPPLLGTNTSVTNASPAAGYTLTAEIDLSADGGSNSLTTVRVSAVPGPIIGAGIPGLLMACGGLFALARRRRKEQV